MPRPASICVAVLLLSACGDNPVDPWWNRPPIASLGGPYEVDEGRPLEFDTQQSADYHDHDNLTYTWDFGDRATLVTRGAEVASHTYRDEGSFVVQLIVSDPFGAADTATATVIVWNVAPRITLLKLPDQPVPAGTPVAVEVRYEDPGLDDTLRASIFWSRSGSGEGNGLLGPGIVEHTFWDPDLYEVSLIVEDNDGALTDQHAGPIVVVPPSSAGRRSPGFSRSQR